MITPLSFSILMISDIDDLLNEPVAWKRNQNDLAQNRDVAYDSDDSSKWTAPDWKPKELSRSPQ